MGYLRPNKGADLFPKRAFIYDVIKDVYHCPNQQTLHYRTTNRLGYREYASDPPQFKHCSQRSQSIHSQDQTKVVTRHV